MPRRSRTRSARPETPARIDPPELARKPWLYAIVLLLAVVAAYANSLSGPFILDDQASIVQNRGIQDLSRLDRVLVPAPDSPVAGRPLVSLSFAINYALGGLNVVGYHAGNIAMHVVCALLLFGVIRRTLAWPRVRTDLVFDPSALAFAPALLWAIHPLNTEVVDYLTQRTESMMAACYLLTLYASIRALQSRHTRRWTFVAIVACAAGMLCKESMASAPLMVLLYDRVFVFESWRDALRRRRGLYAGLAASWLVLAAMMATNPRGAVTGSASGVSVWTYLLNQTVMIAHYLRLTIWPDSLVVFYGWPVPLTLGDVLPYAALIVLLLIATLVAFTRWPMVAFLGAWFFITLAPASSVIPIATEVGAERRMYLPLAAILMLAVIAAHELIRRVRVPVRAMVFVLVAVAAALAATTFARNREYESSVVLARTVLERRPTAIAHHILAEQLMLSGASAEAISHYRHAVALGNSRASYALGVALFNERQWGEAIDQLEAFVRTASPPRPLVPRWLEPTTSELLLSHVVMSRAFAAQGHWPQSADAARLALAIAPAHLEARRQLADALFAQQRWPDAANEYRAYLSRRPDDVEVLINYGVSLVATERLRDAAAAFERAASINPRHERAARLRALAREDLKNLGEDAAR